MESVGVVELFLVMNENTDWFLGLIWWTISPLLTGKAVCQWVKQCFWSLFVMIVNMVIVNRSLKTKPNWSLTWDPLMSVYEFFSYQWQKSNNIIMYHSHGQTLNASPDLSNMRWSTSLPWMFSILKTKFLIDGSYWNYTPMTSFSIKGALYCVHWENHWKYFIFQNKGYQT